MVKRKVLSWLVIVSVIIVCLSFTTGIVRLNSSPKSFGVLIDNQTGEDITSIRLIVKPYGKNGEPGYEHEMISSVKEMLPGNYEEFNFYVKNQEEASAEKCDLVITVQINGLESKYPVQDATGIPMAVGKKSLIKLVGDKTLGFKSEYVDLL